MKIWPGECHVHAGIRPDDVARDARRAPRRRPPHPSRVRMRQPVHVRGIRDPGARLRAPTCSRPRAWCSGPAPRRGASSWSPPRRASCTGWARRRPTPRFYAMCERAVCRYMKMITLEKLRDSLRDMRHRVTVDPELAAAGPRRDPAHGRDHVARPCLGEAVEDAVEAVAEAILAVDGEDVRHHGGEVGVRAPGQGEDLGMAPRRIERRPCDLERHRPEGEGVDRLDGAADVLVGEAGASKDGVGPIQHCRARWRRGRHTHGMPASRPGGRGARFGTTRQPPKRLSPAAVDLGQLDLAHDGVDDLGQELALAGRSGRTPPSAPRPARPPDAAS